MNTATSPGIQEMLISKGLESFINGSYSEAAGYFEEILSNKPNDPDALHHLAGCQIQLQEYESAQETIQKVLNLDSKNSLAWFRLGQIHYLCKRYESAVDSFGKAIEIKPEFADAWFMGGQALIQNSAINDGMLALENALLLNSSSVVFNEIFAKHFIEYKHDVGTLVITGGIGDILLCLPFLLQNKNQNLKINVLTHFKGAQRIFDSLAIPVNKIKYYSNDVERLKLQPEIIGPREFYPCPKRWFFDVNPFDSKIIDLDNSRPTLGVQLGGSTISIDLQSKIGLPKKSLPISLLHSILSLDAFNVVLFGSQEEIDSYGLVKNDHLHFACYQNIDESLSLVSQCDCFVGSDSSIKSMTAMLQIPTFVWMGDYQDPYRDANFIDVYSNSPSFKIFRFKDINLDLQKGFKELTNYFLDTGLIDKKILERAQKKEIPKNGNTVVAVKKDPSEHLEAGNYFASSRGIIRSCNSHNKELRSSSDHIDADLLRNHFPGGSIYICTEAILNFVDHFLGKIDQPFVLVTGDSDIRITDAVLRNEKIQNILANPHLIQWFAQNLDVKHDKLQRMPIGMDYHTMQTAADYWGPGIQSPQRQEDDLFSIASRTPEFSKRSFMAYCNWTNSINSIDRQECITKIQKELCVIEQRRVPRVQSWENQAKHMFVISPEGIGMDCHRTWEALLLGCIPVVKKSNYDEIFDDLPVWIVEDWSEFNSKNLIEKISYFCKKKYNYNKLLLKYWSSKINNGNNVDELILSLDQFKVFLQDKNTESGDIKSVSDSSKINIITKKSGSKKEQINIIVTCNSREEYLHGLNETIRGYKNISPNVCLSYNGNIEEFPCDIKIANSGHQMGDIELTLAGYHHLKNNGVNKYLKICIDSWLLNDEFILEIFDRMDSSKSAYAGNYWLPEGEPNHKFSLSSDIIFADVTNGNIFENFRWDGLGFETSIYKTINDNGFKYSIIQEREPIHWENRYDCEKAQWVMHHDLAKNNFGLWSYNKKMKG